MSQTVYKVLVADDDPTVGLLMQAALSADHFSVTVVDDGMTALAAFKQFRYDLILLDVEMPEMDGFEVCAAIRQQAAEKIPIILVTGHSDQLFIDRATALGAGHISKPVDWSVLGMQLQELLRTVR